MSDKPKLVILPGWGGSHETWQEFIGIASNDFDVMCIDLPCFGDEPCPSEVWGVYDYAKFVQQKLSSCLPAREGIRSQASEVILLGHSFGGQVAVCLASKHPEMFEKLILVGAAVIRPNKIFRRTFFGAIAKLGKVFFSLPFIETFEGFAKKVLYRMADSPDYSETAGIKRDIYRKIIRQDYTQSLKKLSIPTLVLWGSHDRMTPLRYGKRIVNLLARGELHVFPRKHHALHREVTKEMVSAIKEFVESK